MRATSKLRELLGAGKPLLVPGGYNALSAEILEMVGFPAVPTRSARAPWVTSP